jgi:hypothetical protein
MGDRSKFEQMLEYLINDEEARARELFHDIVVAKSREIYENLLAEDFQEEETEEARDGDDDDVEENYGMGGNMQPPQEPGMEAFGGDASDDMLGDVGDEGDDEMDMGGDMDSMGGDMDMDMGDGDDGLGDRLDDLEAELAAIRDEFEEKLGGDEEGGDMDDMGGDGEGDAMPPMGDEEDDEVKDGMFYEESDDEDDKDKDTDSDDEQTDEDFIREYVEKVGGGNYNTWGKMGDDGQNTKSPVAGPNRMGGTSENILKGGVYNGKEVGAGSTIEGNGVFKQSKPQIEDFGNVNKPGGNAGKTGFKKKEPGHGAEKKGEAEGKAWGAGTGGAVGQVGSLNTKSLLSGAPKRAK